MGKTIRGFNGQPSEPDYPLPADLPFSVAPDNGARALAERLANGLAIEFPGFGGLGSRKETADRLAAAILANGAVFLPAAAELGRLRRIEAAALALNIRPDRAVTDARALDALRAALAPEGSAGTACRCGTNVRQGIRHYWCLTHDAEWLLSAMACARAAEGSARDGG